MELLIVNKYFYNTDEFLTQVSIFFLTENL